jgi:hypothetical protein
MIDDLKMQEKKVTAKYANHAKEEADWGFPSRIWRISRLSLFASCRRPLSALCPGGEDSCQTNPISSAGGRPGGPGYPTIPLLYHSTIPGGGLSCQTKPNLGDLEYLGNGVEGLVQTNPIWRDARCGLPPRACAGRLYKQTQIRRVATGLAVQTNPICACRMGRRGRGRGLLRQTNPIRTGAM